MANGAALAGVGAVQRGATATALGVQPRGPLDTQVDDALRGTLEQSGFATQGFGGGTLGDYQAWFQGQFGMDPFSLAQDVNLARGKAGEAGPGGPLSGDPAAWIAANPLSFSIEQGFTGATPQTERGLLAASRINEETAAFRQETERQQGLGLLQWLMGQASQLSAGEFSRLAGPASQLAQSQIGFNAPFRDFGAELALMGQQRMMDIQQRAGQFNFARDLLPSLITAGGGFGGRGRSASGAGQRSSFSPLSVLDPGGELGV
jgi:hypothetical protein